LVLDILGNGAYADNIINVSVLAPKVKAITGFADDILTIGNAVVCSCGI
jgi:hypothetical protein